MGLTGATLVKMVLNSCYDPYIWVSLIFDINICSTVISAAEQFSLLMSNYENSEKLFLVLLFCVFT